MSRRLSEPGDQAVQHGDAGSHLAGGGVQAMRLILDAATDGRELLAVPAALQHNIPDVYKRQVLNSP